MRELSIFADPNVVGNVIVKFGDKQISVKWKVANGIIPMVYAACQAAHKFETEGEVPPVSKYEDRP